MKITLMSPGKTISEALADAGLMAPELPCGGKGLCGKCRIMAKGALEPPGETEKKLLGVMTAENDGYEVRLACLAVMRGETEVMFDAPESPRGADAADHGRQQKKPDLLAALDIGTTNIEAEFFDMSGNRLSGAVIPNPQRRYGADVISRIGADKEHHTELVSGLRQAISDLFASSGGRVVRSVAVGNTTMLHFFADRDVSGMGAYPFTPETLFGEEITIPEIPDCAFYLPRCVSAFVGADVVCSLLEASPGRNERVLVADLGTNGEIMLYNKGRILCASTAAGPALEGAEISCGMRAVKGAVDNVRWNGKSFLCHVIGDGEAKGICGSGLISAAAAMLGSGVMDVSGYIEAPVTLAPGVVLTEDDIRALQLAKSAIRAGIDTLEKHCPGKTDRICLAGGFGSGIDISLCERIGLLPRYDGARYDILGNASLKGAARILTGGTTEYDMLAKSAELIPLAENSFFTDSYIENMLFP